MIWQAYYSHRGRGPNLSGPTKAAPAVSRNSYLQLACRQVHMRFAMGIRAQRFIVVLLTLLVITAAGCGSGPSKPQVRCASYPTATAGTLFSGPDLGEHGYTCSYSEMNGIAYTCAAGHIDIAHLRKAADWTFYLAANTARHLEQGDTRFKFKLYEPSLYLVELTYPEDWQNLPEQDRQYAIHDISVRLGQYFAHIATAWHEILSWYGYRSTRLFPEFASAFSWEDSFSNLLGTHIAAIVLQNVEEFDLKDTNDFDQLMTLALELEMEKLKIQPSRVARRAAANVRGDWYSGDLMFVDMKRRNFDIGTDDGFISPVIAPVDAPECQGVQPQAYPAPDLDFLAHYGFSIKFEVEVRDAVKNKILQAAYPDGRNKRKRIEPSVHFARIMDHIGRQALQRYPGVGETRLAAAAAAGKIDKSSEAYFSDLTILNTAGSAAFDDQCPIEFKDLAMMSYRWLEDDPCSGQMW